MKNATLSYFVLFGVTYLLSLIFCDFASLAPIRGDPARRIRFPACLPIAAACYPRSQVREYWRCVRISLVWLGCRVVRSVCRAID